MHILQNKIFYYNLLLMSIILLIGYKIFLSNKISIKQSVNLTNKEIKEYTLLAQDGNQSAIKYLWAYYAIYKKDKEMSCYWWSKKNDQSFPPKYCSFIRRGVKSIGVR